MIPLVIKGMNPIIIKEMIAIIKEKIHKKKMIITEIKMEIKKKKFQEIEKIVIKKIILEMIN